MKERITQILTDLERVRENLLALSDDVWLSIEHNDSQALQKGFEFKLAFNKKLDTFNQITSDISSLVQQFTEVPIETVTVAEKGSPENERIIRELDLVQSHTIEESFTYKRPYGFVLQGQAYKDVKTWRKLYELFCQQLAANDLNRFKDFLESPEIKTPRGGLIFYNEPTKLREALEVASSIYAEGNLSANSIRDKIKLLLSVFGINSQELSIYLREDRNVAEEA
jgi:hypothetical protein